MYKIQLSAILLTTILATNLFAQTSSKNRYNIIGNVTGYADSTKIYLNDPSSGSTIILDSTFIIKNKFYFKGSIIEDAMNVIVSVEANNDYKYFWLENNEITFKARKGHFKDAVIAGSKTQKEKEEFETDSKDATQANIDFIKARPNSMHSAYLLNIYGIQWGKETTSSLYNTLSDKIKNSSYCKSVQDFIELNKEINIGDAFINFTQKNIEGNDISLSDYKNKIVLLEFWSSDCGPCRKENPLLVSYYNEFKQYGFDILGVTLDSKRTYWETAVRYDKLPWQTVCDLNGWKNKVALMYGISRLPTNYLIDRNGIIIAKDLRGEELKNKLLEICK